MITAPTKTMLVRTGALLLAGGLMLGMLSACSPKPEPTPTKTALFSSEEEAFAAAEETYRAFVDAQNAIDPADTTTFDAVYRWTVDDAYTAVRENLTQLHAEHVSITGDSKITRLSPLSASLISGEVSMHACVDVSATDVLSQDGESIVPANRADFQSLLVDFRPTSDGELRVSRTTGGEAPCTE